MMRHFTNKSNFLTIVSMCLATATVLSSVANSAESTFPEGYFFMTTKGGAALTLESDPLTLLKKANTTGMAWKAIPAGNGYFHLTTIFHEEKGMVLEGGSPGISGELGGGAVMVTRKADGTLWKAVKVPGGYHLHNKFLGKEQFLMTKSKAGSVPYMADSSTGGGVSEWLFTPNE